MTAVIEPAPFRPGNAQLPGNLGTDSNNREVITYIPPRPDFANISPIPRPSNQGDPPQGPINTLLPVFTPQPPEPRDPPTREPPGEAKAPIKNEIEREIAGPSGSNTQVMPGRVLKQSEMEMTAALTPDWDQRSLPVWQTQI